MTPRDLTTVALAATLFLAQACGGDATPRPGAVDPDAAQATRPRSPRHGNAAKATSLPALSLESLEPRESATPAGEAPPARNLFAFEEDPAIAIERARLARETQEKEREAQRLRDRWQGPPLPPPPPPPPQPPPIPFVFIGYLGPPQARIGVFSLSGGKELVLARSGDRIQQRFIVKEVGFESAEIGFEGFTETRRITLTPGS